MHCCQRDIRPKSNETDEALADARSRGSGRFVLTASRNAALATLRRLPEIGVNFIDTADSYGPDVSEELIREALHPYEGLLIATKAGLTRSGPDQWTPNGQRGGGYFNGVASLTK